MGCFCSKATSSREFAENSRRKKELNKSSRRLTSSFRRDEVAVIVHNNGVDATESLISKQLSEENAPSEHVLSTEGIMSPGIEEMATVHAGKLLNLSSNRFEPQLSRKAVMPNGIQGAQIAAGWPAWLTAVAGEAIKGWVPRKAESFEKLDKIGQGTYSSVYRGRDLESGEIVAMKKVRFVNMDPESVRFMAREIIILRRLDHPNVMKLEGLVTSRVSGSLYLIFQYMEHDLAGLAATPGIRFTESQIKCYMQQLLMGLEHCHNCGVLHRDIKGSNLLIDNNGNMKIGDFGLSTFFHTNQKQPLTSRVVTLWYRPPELLLGSTDYSIGVDLWSAGCILAELFYGKPIMPGRTEVEQLHKIFKLCGSPSEEYWRKSKLPHATIFKPQNPYKRCVNDVFVNFPSSALALLDVLLAIEPEKRGSASSALQNEFFRTTPLPCSPSTLPKYPPSKEFDAKLRDDEIRRKKAVSGKARGSTSSLRSGSQDSKAIPAPDANAESLIAIQKRKAQANTKSNSEKYNLEEDSGTGFPIGPSGRPTLLVQTVQFSNPNAYGSLVENGNRSPMAPQDGSEVGVRRFHMHQGTIGLSRFSNSVAVRGDTNEMDTSSSWAARGPSRPRYNQLDGAESSKWFHALLDRPKSSHKKEKQASGKQSSTGFSASKRIHYSGPLLPPGGNLEEMLKEHERQIQHAVRKARLGKTRMKKAYGENGPGDSLLNHVSGSGR